MKTHLNTHRARFGGGLKTFGDFVCITCHNFVSAEAALSNVQHRNHCPYCLSSRHLDLYEAGDRLSACKACMRPVALTLKKTVKKYAGANRGELMLVHLCEMCARLSINRIAADDDNQTILQILEASSKLEACTQSLFVQNEIHALTSADRSFVYEQLWGHS